MSAKRRINRRQFLGRVAAGAGAVVIGPGLLGFARQLAAAPGPNRPNILVIMSDEHNGAILGCAGNPVIRTPHLDALAARGVVFENAYCNSPLCVPSRLSFTSGKYASRVGAWSNSCWLPSPDYPSLPRILNAAGYESFLCGKMHYDETCRYGFKEIGSDVTNRNFMTGKGERRNPDDLPATTPISPRFTEFATSDTSGHIRHDETVTKGTVDFLARRGRAEKPFFLLAGYLCPHFPLIVPKPLWENYKDKLPMPNIPAGYLESLPLNYKHERVGFRETNVPPETVKFGRELYFGLTQWVDNQIGLVLDALAKSPFADNTVVIYTTDHGENMGEHGLWWKSALFDTAAHVPLIVSYPTRWKPGRRRAGACSLVDVVRTIADVGGAKAPDDWNGASLVPWLDDPATPWKNVAVSEYYAHFIASGFAMIRMGDWKYVYHTPADARHAAERELYDLASDPGELVNLARRAEHADRVARMHDSLVKELGENPDKTELRCRADYAKGYGRKAPAGRDKGNGD